MTTTAAGIGESVGRASSARRRRFVVLPVVMAACSVGLGAILASLLDVSPLLASAAGAAYFCIAVLTLSIVFRLLDPQT